MTTKKKNTTTSRHSDGRGKRASALPNNVGPTRPGKARQADRKLSQQHNRPKKKKSSLSSSAASITTTNAVVCVGRNSSKYKTLIEQANEFCEKGEGYRKVGKYTQAIKQYQQALVIRESLCGRYDTIEIEDIYFDLFDCHEREKQRRKNLELLGNSEEEEDHGVVDMDSIPYNITVKTKNRRVPSPRKYDDHSDPMASVEGSRGRTSGLASTVDTDEKDDYNDDYYKDDKHMELERTNLYIERYRHMSTSWKTDTPYNGDYSMIDKILQRRNPTTHSTSKLETYIKKHGQCVAYEKMGDMQRSLGNFDLALDAYHKAIVIEQEDWGPSGPTLSYLCRKVACIISLLVGNAGSSSGGSSIKNIDWKLADKISSKWMDTYKRHLSSDVCYAIQKGDECYQKFDYHHAILEYQWGATSTKSSSIRTLSTYTSNTSSILSDADDIPLIDLVIEEEESPAHVLRNHSSGTSSTKLAHKKAKSQPPSDEAQSRSKDQVQEASTDDKGENHCSSTYDDIQIVLELVQREFSKVHDRMDTLESRVERHSVKLKKRVDKKLSKVLDSIEKVSVKTATNPDQQRRVPSNSQAGHHHQKHHGRYLEVGSDDDDDGYDDDVADEDEIVGGSQQQEAAAAAAKATCWTKVKQLVMHHLPSCCCCHLSKLECWTWFGQGNNESRRMVAVVAGSHSTSSCNSSYSNNSIAADDAASFASSSCYTVEM